MQMVRTTNRQSYRFRICDSCKGSIKVGDRYLEHVASPEHEDLGNPRWWRSRECEECARRYGRQHYFDGDR